MGVVRWWVGGWVGVEWLKVGRGSVGGWVVRYSFVSRLRAIIHGQTIRK